MPETPEEENARLLAPLIVERNHAAHEVLSAMLQGRHEAAAELMTEYQMAALAVEAGMQICFAWDSGNVTVTDNVVEIHTDPEK